MNVRLIFMRVLVNGFGIAVVALIVPGIHVVDPGIFTHAVGRCHELPVK